MSPCISYSFCSIKVVAVLLSVLFTGLVSSWWLVAFNFKVTFFVLRGLIAILSDTKVAIRAVFVSIFLIYLCPPLHFWIVVLGMLLYTAYSWVLFYEPKKYFSLTDVKAHSYLLVWLIYWSQLSHFIIVCIIFPMLSFSTRCMFFALLIIIFL